MVMVVDEAEEEVEGSATMMAGNEERVLAEGIRGAPVEKHEMTRVVEVVAVVNIRRI